MILQYSGTQRRDRQFVGQGWGWGVRRASREGVSIDRQGTGKGAIIDGRTI